MISELVTDQQKHATAKLTHISHRSRTLWNTPTWFPNLLVLHLCELQHLIMTPLLYTTRRGMQPRASHPRSRKQRRLADNFCHGARVCLLLGLTLKRGFLQDYWLHYSIKLNRTLHQNQQDKMSSDSDNVMFTIKRMVGIRILKNPFVDTMWDTDVCFDMINVMCFH